MTRLARIWRSTRATKRRFGMRAAALSCMEILVNKLVFARKLVGVELTSSAFDSVLVRL